MTLWVRRDWDPAATLSQPGRAAVRALSVAHRMLPAAAFIQFWGFESARSQPPGLFLLRAIVSAPVLFVAYLFVMVLARHAATLERRLAADPLPFHLDVSARAWMSCLLKPALLLVAYLLWALGILPAWLSLGLAAAVVARLFSDSAEVRPGWKRRVRARIEMPDLPLRDEIQLLLEKAQLRGRKLFAQPGQENNDPFKGWIMYRDRRGMSFSGMRDLCIPLGALQSLDPGVYTAALSRELWLGHHVPAHSRTARHLFVAAGCLAPGLVLIFLLLTSAVTHAYGSGSGTRLAGLVVIVAVATVALFACYFLLWRAVTSGARVRNAQYDSYFHWHDADPDAGRSVEDYVAALALVEAAMQSISDPDVVLHRLRLTPGLMVFLSHCGPGMEAIAFDWAREVLVAHQITGQAPAHPIAECTA